VRSLPEGPWSVHDVAMHYESLGIPHFQRGLVWGAEATSLLLESIFFGTPCGTIILWEPLAPYRDGVPLPKSKELRYLVIDGQQRIRSLYGALVDSASDPDVAGEENDNQGGTAEDRETAKRVWCLNLTRLPELEGLLSEDLGRYPLFRWVAHPHDPHARFKYNLLPIRELLDDQRPNLRDLTRLDVNKGGDQEDEVFRRLEAMPIVDRIRALRSTKVFWVNILKESRDRKTNHLPDVVDIYNRINSAGKRVEAEERAFATLVSVHSGASNWLGKLFESVHGMPSQGLQDVMEGLERDEMLRRRKERNFGFKLFIRAFVQVCAYHFGYSVGSNSFSFEVINGDGLQRKLKEDPKVTANLFEETHRVVCHVKQLLSERMNCDDLQMLPETSSLLPIFQLLIQYPQLMLSGAEQYGPILQSLVLRLLLSSPGSQEQVLSLVRAVDNSKTADECVRELDTSILTAAQLRRELPKILKSSDSLQDRYVLLLYWLLRNNGARDLSYGNLSDDKRQKMRKRYGSAYDTEVPLAADCMPEKQHLVPYSQLEKIYGIVRRGRLSRHPANNIGNITYISRALNHFETGLGSQAVDLSLEALQAPENARNHFLFDQEVQQAYKKTLDKMARKDLQAAQVAFVKFCLLRQQQIARAFCDWVEALAPEIEIRDRYEPARRVDPSTHDRLRNLEYPDIIEDLLLECLATKQYRYARGSRAMAANDLAFRFFANGGKGGVKVQLRADRIQVTPLDDSLLCAALGGFKGGYAAAKNGTLYFEPKGDGLESTKAFLEELYRRLIEHSQR
jgi:hypothetical protein